MNSKESSVVYKRFGELAIEAGFLTKQQVDNELNRQKWFVNEGDVIKCGWHALDEQSSGEGGE